MRQTHNRQHRIHTRCRWEEAAVTDEEVFHAVYFTVFIGDRCRVIGSHTARSHLVGGEHHDAIDGHVERSAKIKSDVRDGRKAVQVSQPALRAVARNIARERCVNVPVGQDEVSAVEQREDLALAAVGKIGGVQERKRGGRKQTALLPAPGCRFHKWRRIPLREMQAIAADFEPAFEQVELRALPGAVYAFNHNERARVGARGLK